MPGPLATALMTQLTELDRWFAGRLASEPAPAEEIVSAERYLDVEFLRAAIARAASTQLHAKHYLPDGTEPDDGADIDLRIAVSRFTRQYASSISAVALVALARGVGLDLSAARCRMIVRSNIPFLVALEIRESDAIRSRERPTTWPAAGPVVDTLDELRAYVWRKLYGENLAPLFARAREVTRVSPRLMWTNAAEWVGLLSDTAEEYLSPERAAPFVDDRRAILAADSLPGVAGRNPMGGLIEWKGQAEDFPHGTHERQVCCVTFYLPDRLGRLCANCPFLPVDERLALIRERHGVPMGQPGGPAEKIAIQRGLEKLGLAPTR